MSVRFYIKTTIVVLIFLFVFAFCWHVVSQSKQKIQNVKVTTNGALNYISQKQIMEAVGAKKDVNWFYFNVDALQSELLKYAGVSKVDVIKKWPDRLQVDITEAKAIAYWGDNKSLVLEDGAVISPKHFTTVLSLPVFSGRKDDIAQIRKMYQQLSGLSKLFDLSIKTINFQGNQWSIELSNDIHIRLGKSNVQGKLKLLLESLKLIKVAKGQKITAIDMRYRSGFSVKTAAK